MGLSGWRGVTLLSHLTRLAAPPARGATSPSCAPVSNTHALANLHLCLYIRGARARGGRNDTSSSVRRTDLGPI
eukprot:8989258-Pyramimonas_sp.AAC.1